MRAECRHGRRQQNDTGCDLTIEMPAGNMEIAGRVLFARLQQEEEQENLDGKTANPCEEVAVRHQAGASVIFRRQLRNQRRTRHLIHRERQPYTDCQNQKPDKQAVCRQAFRRVPGEVVSQPDRKERRIHERMPPADTGAYIV